MTHERPSPEYLLSNRAYIIARMTQLALIRKQADWEWGVLVQQRIKIDEEIRNGSIQDTNA